MLRFAPLLLLAWPLAEIALFIVVGRFIGVVPTLVLIVAAVLLGIIVLRQQGLGVLNRMRANVSTGTVPGEALFDGMVLAIAAVFLIIPGFMSDAIALALLVPPVRKWLYRALTRNVRVVQTTATYRTYPVNDTPTRIDAPSTIDLDDDDWQRK
ncbi:UPF0716 protein FxsA [Devosia crocina]|uniref:UPF0716 protein FxsA n=1 Tax=Devosia crocina TaxID=429728 RepID=A0A1I7NSW4_9HYPH|nr:FxsA family protein [Devosia crocina]SFV37678.1 UPF0716 protein FxsA [Devosia crocina]